MPPILLLHGALGARDQLLPLAERLAAAGAGEVLAIDFRGHGGRPRGEGAPGLAFAMAEFVDDMRSALADLGGGPALAFGYSMGGYAACRLEAESPGSLAGILTLGTKFDWDAPTAAVEAGRLDPDAIEAKVPRFAQALEARHGAMGWRAVVIATAGLLAGLGEVGGFGLGRAAAVACPVRVMLGDRDELVPLEEAARYARAFPAGELAVLPRTPHPLERASVERLAGEVLDLALSLS